MVETHVYEEAMVAQALESARVNLQRTLTDLQQEKEWSNQLLESIVEGIMTLDNQHRITFFSHGAERITGWSRDEVLDRSCDETFHLADSNAPFSQFIPAPGQRNKIVVVLADGHWASLSVTGARLVPAEAGEAEIALVFRDVSSEEIIHHLLGQYIANVSHEFRTPLAALAASVELLLEEESDYSPEETAELLSSLHLGILSLQTLVDNLLESASIEAGHFRVSPRPYSLPRIIQEVSATMQPLLEKYEQRLVLDLPQEIPVVRIDPRRTVQVLVNLISNASKYGPPDEEILLSASQVNDYMRVEISDRGPGISADNRDDLYRRFVYPQPDPENLKIGAGLGLSVVKAIVEAQGGQTGLDDRQAGGSTFWFTLPLVKEEKGF
jgi:PAS domain S-box-containing protein